MTQIFQRYQSLKNASNLSIQETENWDSLIDSVLSQVVLSTIRKYQQKLNVGMQDSVSDLLDTFKQKVTQHIFDTNDAWRAASRTDVDLFPRGCRFCFSRGSSTIVVIEQDPQVRSLSFQGRMLSEDGGGSLITNQRVALSLPYTLFFFHFRNGQFAHVYHAWRTRPLESLDDMIMRPLLPNIHDNLDVCLGGVSITINGSMTQQSNQILTSFWSSVFNDDLSTHWWSKGSIDPRLRSAHSWADNSEDDPMFILGVNFRTIRTVDEMLKLISNAENESPDESHFRHAVSDEIDEHVNVLFSKIMRYCKKTKFEKHFPKDIHKELSDAFSTSVADLIDVIYSLNVEIDHLGEDLKVEEAELEPKSKFWVPYST